MKRFLYYSTLSFFVLLTPSCEGDSSLNDNNPTTETGADLTAIGVQIVEEINLARGALAGGEEAWGSYMVDVVEPTLEYLFGGDRYLERIDPITNTNLYLELKNVFKDGKVIGGGDDLYADILQSDFPSIGALNHSDKLSIGCKKWTNYFIENEITDYHGDFSGSIKVSDDDEKGNAEVVAPPFHLFDSPRAVVVAWLYDQGNNPRGHRVFLLNPELKQAGGFVDTIQGGATARLAF